MARPQKNDVDYFPFYCKEGASTNYIDEKYQNNGFAIWVKLLRLMAKTDFHYLDLNKRKNLMNASTKCKCSEELLVQILDDLAILEEIDEQLWAFKIVYSEKFVQSIEDAYKKRSNDLLSKKDLITLLVGLGTLNEQDWMDWGGINPQSKVKYSIVNNTKENKSKVDEENLLQKYEYEKILLVQSEKFVNEWNKWLAYRKEIKKPYKSYASMRLQILELKNYTEEVAFAMMNQSIKQSWQGIFELKTSNTTTTNGRTAANKQSDFKTGGAGKL
jgi:hypothetical protein